MVISRALSSMMLAAGVACAPSLAADNWTIHMTVDNQFSAWFGNSMQTTLAVGSGNSWPTTYTFNVGGANPTDYFYVATSSDHSAAQGFIGEFHNVTQGYQFLTGLSGNWEVFPAGRYLQQLFGMTNPWPASVMPTQAQIDSAITYATTLGLWIPPTSFPGYTNGVGPWGFRPGISANAHWIWHRDPNGPANPLTPGYNHEEFLVFRVPGVPSPVTALPLALMGVFGLRRRR
ncbi:MAG: hypothetical protein FJ255_02350 [Phycisphaerae bacterium]|nr:hypothetical protein [Phycisphaerae bacterium]